MTPRKPGSLKPYTTGEIAKELGMSVQATIKFLDRHSIPYTWSGGREGVGRRQVKVKDWNAWKRSQSG